MAPPTISCNVIDRRSGLPAVGMPVILRCLQPQSENSEFKATTDSQGFIFEWPGYLVPAISLLHFLVAHNCCETTTWQMGFLTTEYFRPIHHRYTVADVNFTITQGQQAPHITLFADIYGYETRIESLKDNLERQVSKPKRQYQRFSKQQNEALIEHYVDEPCPSSETYIRLSEDLKLSRQQTMQWFRRQRAQGRHVQKQSMLQHQVTAEADRDNPRTSIDIVTTVDAGVPVVSTALICSGEKVLRRSSRQPGKTAK